LAENFITMTIFPILTLVFFQGKLDFYHWGVKNGLAITISLKYGRFLVLPLVMPFFKILKNHEKGPKPVPKLQKRGGKWKKGIKNLTLEFNLVRKNGRFRSNVDVTLVFF